MYFTSTYILFSLLNIPFTPISPVDINVYGEYVGIQWEILEEGYEYKLEILTQPKCSSVKISFPYTRENSQEVKLSTDGEYCWRLKYRKQGETEYLASDAYRFTYQKEEYNNNSQEDIGNEEENNTNTQSEEGLEIEDNSTKDIENVLESIPKENTKTHLYQKEDIEQYTEEVKEDHKEVLGMQTAEAEQEDTNDSCRIIYYKRTKEYSIQNCSFNSPKINKAYKYEIDEDYDYVLIEGEIIKESDAELTILDCMEFSILKPSTWFGCKETKNKKNISIRLIYSPSVSINGKKSTISAYSTNNSSFFLKIFSQKLNNEEIFLTFDIYFYINVDDIWLDFKDTITTELTYTNGYSVIGKKDFEYIFGNIIGVTQWHGYTAYASPHTGIDFGAVKQPILSPADGTIYDIGWDDYYGECNSGGKYIKIRHDNGMYTVYMHLDSYTKEDGTEWKVGEEIKEGEQVGISGNTGAYNCQTLGYHLHYELRKNSKQISHTDPVPYTDIDWDLIPTINWHIYPGRLTGDNPHPNF